MTPSSKSTPYRRNSRRSQTSLLPQNATPLPENVSSTEPGSRITSDYHSEEEWLDDDNVQDDVLFPQFSPGKDDIVDLDIFDEMVEEHSRKLSAGTLKLTRTLSRQGQLYGEHRKNSGIEWQGVDRYEIYSTAKDAEHPQNLQHLLTLEGSEAIRQLSRSTGWWVDSLSPTDDEMRVLSKVFHIHPLTTEDIQAQEPREKVEVFPNYTFVCFRSFDIDRHTDNVRPFNFYILIFKDGLLTFHFKQSDLPKKVRQRAERLRGLLTITPDWLSYALVDAVTDEFAPIIAQIEVEAVSIDELSLVLRKSEQADMLKRISRCRRRSTQLSRLLGSKLDVLKSLKKRYEDRTREKEQHGETHLVGRGHEKGEQEEARQKTFNDVLLYMGDIQDHIVTMVQNINHYDRILHRAHTNYLAQVNLELTQTYAMTNMVMNRLTFLATIFIPLTLIGGLWGMNVYVPGKDYLDDSFFYWILAGMALYTIAMAYFGKRMSLL